MADIFVSYSKQHPRPTRDLAAYLESQGYSVWWDSRLTAGEDWREVIEREIDAAAVVVVIWTPESITSRWVIAEANRADGQRKLVTLRTREVDPRRIPIPYSTCHTDVIDDREAILKAVMRVAGARLPRLPEPIEPLSGRPSWPAQAASEEAEPTIDRRGSFVVAKNSDHAPAPRVALGETGATFTEWAALASVAVAAAGAFAFWTPATPSREPGVDATTLSIVEGKPESPSQLSKPQTSNDSTATPSRGPSSATGSESGKIPPYVNTELPFVLTPKGIVEWPLHPSVPNGGRGGMGVTPSQPPKPQTSSDATATPPRGPSPERTDDRPKPVPPPPRVPTPAAGTPSQPSKPQASVDAIAAVLMDSKAYAVINRDGLGATRRFLADDTDAQEVLALGGTYDPDVLEKLGTFFSEFSDLAQARAKYRRAADLGSKLAAARLKELDGASRHRRPVQNLPAR